jgi:signal transduction histidine kinase
MAGTKTNGSRAGYETARLALARLRLTGAEARAMALRQVAETGARALGATRASLWTTSTGADGRARCECVFDLPSAMMIEDETSREYRLPTLVDAFATRRVLSIPEVDSDPRTVDMRGRTRGAEPIISLLAAPVIRGGGVSGFVSFEQSGDPRIWSQAERDFAASAADMAALFLEQADRLEIEASLRERRELELVDEKMTALERLARTVAHDVNNVLAAVDLIGMALERNGSDDAAKQGGAVRRAVGVGKRLVEQLSLFARGPADVVESVDLGALLRDAQPMLERLVQGARLELDIETEATVAVDRSEFQQVALNLCVNAGEAVSEGGLVRVELREPRPDELLSPTTVVLVVSDDGQGMDAETLSHIFEPYYSRKQPGRGLGLAIVYGIVERAGGTTMVDSAPGRGTTFKIALPRSFDPAPTSSH